MDKVRNVVFVKSQKNDFMLKIMVEDMASYQNFVMNKLSTIDNIGNTQSIFVMGEIKHSTALSI